MHQKQIAEVREFNRFYTRITGLLDKHFLDSQYTLPEVRILYEIYHHENIQAGEIAQSIGIDKSYLSRMLSSFEKKKSIGKKRSAQDARSWHLSLTAKGKKEFELLNTVQEKQVENLLRQLSPQDCEMLIANMAGIKKILSKTGS